MVKLFLKGYFFLGVQMVSSLYAAAPQEVIIPPASSMALVNKINGDTLQVQGRAAEFCAWFLSGKDGMAKKAVTGLFIWCIAYTLYQSAKSIGTTLWSFWHDKDISPEMRREIERVVVLMKQQERNGQVIELSTAQGDAHRGGVQHGEKLSDTISTQVVTHKEGGSMPPSLLSEQDIMQLVAQLVAKNGNNTQAAGDKNGTVQHASTGVCVCGECHKHRSRT